MTIEQIITELEKEKRYVLNISTAKSLTEEMQQYFKGQANGINKALYWLNYIKYKEGE